MTNGLQAYEYLKSKEAAAFLRCSDRTLARWRAEGIGPSYYQHRGRVLYAVAVLRAWRNDHEIHPVRCEP